MPNLAALLKSEITRLARKEIRLEIEPLKKSAAHARSEIAALKKQLRNLQLELNKARRTAKPKPVEELDASAQGFRFRSAGMKAHRTKLGISAKDYGLLLGVSGLSVYKWEDGKVKPRPKMLPRIAAMLRMGKREALRKLEELKSR
jgi:DNA-binding transcriptional regulator YiaG